MASAVLSSRVFVSKEPFNYQQWRSTFLEVPQVSITRTPIVPVNGDPRLTVCGDANISTISPSQKLIFNDAETYKDYTEGQCDSVPSGVEASDEYHDVPPFKKALKDINCNKSARNQNGIDTDSQNFTPADPNVTIIPVCSKDESVQARKPHEAYQNRIPEVSTKLEPTKNRDPDVNDSDNLPLPTPDNLNMLSECCVLQNKVSVEVYPPVPGHSTRQSPTAIYKGCQAFDESFTYAKWEASPNVSTNEQRNFNQTTGKRSSKTTTFDFRAIANNFGANCSPDKCPENENVKKNFVVSQVLVHSESEIPTVVQEHAVRNLSNPNEVTVERANKSKKLKRRSSEEIEELACVEFFEPSPDGISQFHSSLTQWNGGKITVLSRPELVKEEIPWVPQSAENHNSCNISAGDGRKGGASCGQQEDGCLHDDNHGDGRVSASTLGTDGLSADESVDTINSAEPLRNDALILECRTNMNQNVYPYAPLAEQWRNEAEQGGVHFRNSRYSDDLSNLIPENVVDLPISYLRSVAPHLMGAFDKCDPEMNFKCVYCSMLFSNYIDLHKHLAERHYGDDPYECPFCCQRFVKTSSYCSHLDEHVRMNDFPSYTCSVCPKCFSSRWELDSHFHTHERTSSPIVIVDL